MVSTLFFLLIITALLAIPTLQQPTPSKPTYIQFFCLPESGNYTAGSYYQKNLNTVLSSLQTTSASSSFSNTTTGEGLETVFGTYFCRRDLPVEVCNACVKAAAKKIVSDCPGSKEAIVWYEQCTLLHLISSTRYNTVDDSSPIDMWYTPRNVTDSGPLSLTLQETIWRAINESAYGPGSEGFATAEGEVSPFQTLYSLTQCSPGRVGMVCERCLRMALRYINNCCKEYADMAIFFSSCQLRYSVLAPFYDVPNQPPSPVVASPVNQTAAKGNTLTGGPSTGDSIARSQNILGIFVAVITMILLVK